MPGPATDLDADDAKSLNRINLTWKRGSDATYSAIDVSTDNIRWIRLERNTKWARETYNHRNVEPNSDLFYRVTPGHSRWGFGEPDTDPGSTKDAVVPAPVRGLTVTANGQDKLDLSWPLINAANNGGSPIVGYLIEMADDTDNNATLKATPVLVLRERDHRVGRDVHRRRRRRFIHLLRITHDDGRQRSLVPRVRHQLAERGGAYD